MNAVFEKELKQYFNGAVSYVCYIFVFLISGLFIWASCIESSSAEFGSVVSQMALYTFIVPLPVLTMRSFAEERKSRTDQLLYSLPLKMTDVVLGKFFAAAVVFLVPVAVMCLAPLFLRIYGTVNLALSYSAFFAYFLAACAFISVGIFISSLTESQIAAAVITAVLIFFNYYMPYLSQYASQSSLASVIFLVVLGAILGFIVWFATKNATTGLFVGLIIDLALVAIYYLNSDALSNVIPNVLNNISLFDSLSTFGSGTFSLNAIFKYFSVIVVFLFLTVQSAEKRRWE